MDKLSLYGWNEILFRQKQISDFSNLMHGRVSVTHKTCYEVVSESGNFLCELTGNMLYSRDPVDYPCTGDWVLFQSIDSQKGIIFDMLPRCKALYRLKSGQASQKQAIASHIDKAFIVQSLDEHFNVRRIERFMLQLSEEGILPALILTKTDLGYNADDFESRLRHVSTKIPVFYTSIGMPETIARLREFISLAETVVFVGMSGVGKSTLINALCQQSILATAEISEATGKGRHTSTRREMVLMNSDSLSGLLGLNNFARECKYADCRHINEKGCAVIKAVEEGEIDRGVYENYLKLRKEAWHYNASVHEKRKSEKSFSKKLKKDMKLLKSKND